MTSSLNIIMNISAALVIVHEMKTILPQLKKAIPTLEHSLHKGSMGRIGIIGGSRDYTGAPFYAAKSSLLFGGDLAFIFCAKSAAMPIKCYSPEVMVTPLYDDECADQVDSSVLATELCNIFDSYIPRLHAVVLGPGLGRSERLLKALPAVVSKITAANIPMIVDADGLYLVSQNLDVIRGYRRCVLTPNANEFRMLVRRAIFELEAFLTGDSGDECLDAYQFSDAEVRHLLEELKATSAGVTHAPVDDGRAVTVDAEARQLRALCEVLRGVTVLVKGQWDSICWGGEVVRLVGEDCMSSPRRCGGQGDILAGSMAVALYWTLGSSRNAIADDKFSPTATAAMMASLAVRRASRIAFARRGRSMTAPDVLESLGEAFRVLYDE